MWKQWDCNKIVGTQMKVNNFFIMIGRVLQDTCVKFETSKVSFEDLITVEAIIFAFQEKKQVSQM